MLRVIQFLRRFPSHRNFDFEPVQLDDLEYEKEEMISKNGYHLLPEDENPPTSLDISRLFALTCGILGYEGICRWGMILR